MLRPYIPYLPDIPDSPEILQIFPRFQWYFFNSLVNFSPKISLWSYFPFSSRETACLLSIMRSFWRAYSPNLPHRFPSFLFYFIFVSPHPLPRRQAGSIPPIPPFVLISTGPSWAFLQILPLAPSPPHCYTDFYFFLSHYDLTISQHITSCLFFPSEAFRRCRLIDISINTNVIIIYMHDRQGKSIG